MTCRKSHHLPCDYSLFPPVLTLITAALITVTALHVVAAGPETQQMMGAENIRHRRMKHERIFF
ncbi:hypothetical protein [Escherichia coli]|uniref:hypothetical protein n=1 Tax=Escherichia coli TaxID=562 RepID=UPI0032E3A69F